MDHGSGLLQPPKLTVDRIALKSYLKMKAILAVQVLSNTVSQAQQRYYSSGEPQKTSKQC